MRISCWCVIQTETRRRRVVRRAVASSCRESHPSHHFVFFSPSKTKTLSEGVPFDASDGCLPDTKTGELSVYRRNPASVGVRRSRDARRRRRAPILARHPRVCVVRGDRRRRRARLCAERARRRGSTRRGNVSRWRVLNGRCRESSRTARGDVCFFSSCGGENCSPLVGFTSSSVTRWTVVVYVVDHR